MGMIVLAFAAGCVVALIAQRLVQQPSPWSQIVQIAAAGALFAAAWVRFGWSATLLPVLAFLITLVAVAAVDLRFHLIPNRLLLAGGAIVAPLSLLSGFRQPVDAVAGMVIGGGLLFIIALFARGGMGGGDVKLAALVGLALGLRQSMIALALAFVLGGLIGAALLLLRLRRGTDAIAYGPFICLGAAVSLLWGDDLLAWYLGTS